MYFFMRQKLGFFIPVTPGMLGQIFIGPLSDKYGHKRLLMAYMVSFALSSVLCIFVI